MLARIAWNKNLSGEYFSMRLVLPKKIESSPGQFAMVNVKKNYDPLLPRPFSIADNDGNKVDIIYEVKGKGTDIMSHMEQGEELIFTGPLGNGFSYVKEKKNIIFVAGGVGLPPVLFYIKKLIKNGFPKQRIFLFQGAKNSCSVISKDEIEDFKINYFVATDDGSLGYKGFITDLFAEEIDNIKNPVKIFTVGPNLMMKKVVETANIRNIPTEVSMETNMACGIGACLGCILKPVEKIFVQKGYLKTCKDGPVFPGEYFF